MTKDNLLPRTKQHIKQIDHYVNTFPVTPSILTAATNIPFSLRSSPDMSPEEMPDEYWPPSSWDPVELTEDEEEEEIDRDDDDTLIGSNQDAETGGHRTNFLSRRYNVNSASARNLLRNPRDAYGGIRHHRTGNSRPSYNSFSSLFPGSRSRARMRGVRIINTENIARASESPRHDMDDHDDAHLFLDLDINREANISAENLDLANSEDKDEEDDNSNEAGEEGADAQMILEPVAKFEIPENRSIYNITFDTPL